MRDYLKLHLVIVAWGFTAILGKLIEMPPIEMLVWRTALAASTLHALLRGGPDEPAYPIVVDAGA